MSKKFGFQITQKINIALLPNGEYYTSTIQELDEKVLAITVPLLSGNYLLLNPGDKVKAEVADSDAVYSFQASVLGRKMSNQVLLLVLERPKTISRRQRRDYVRFPIILPVMYQLVDPGNPQYVMDDIAYQGETLDISGGGLQIVTMRQLKTNDKMLIMLQLDDNIPLKLHLVGDVSWMVKDNINRNARLGVCFTDISEADRERIISYIFLKMRSRTQI